MFREGGVGIAQTPDSSSPLNMGYNKDPNIENLKRSGFINHGFTL